MFENFFRDMYRDNKPEAPKSSDNGESLRAARRRGEKSGEQIKHADGESMIVNINEREHIAKFVEMSMSHIKDLSEKGFSVKQIMSHCVISTSNEELKRKVMKGVECMALACVASRKGIPLSDEMMEKIRGMDLEGGTEEIRKMIEDHDCEGK